MDRDNLSYILTHLGENRSEYWGSVSPPIVQTSTYAFESVDGLRQAMLDEKTIPMYTRGSNPTIDLLNKKLAALEGSEDALTTASGSAAIAMAVMANLKAGDHVICIENVYSWTNKLLNQMLVRFGVETTMVDGKEVANFENAIRPNTRLIFLESPNSLLFEVQDVEAVCALAKSRGILTIMDNSYASVVSRSPFEFGIDITVHSATKHIAGHSDVVAGLICGSRAMMKHIFHAEFMTLGGIISPFNAWLMLRSLRTLPMRVDTAIRNARAVVDFLVDHPKVDVVHWPFLSSHPQHELAMKQLDKAMPMISIEVKAETVADVERMVNALRYFLIGVSWGGYESLVVPVCAFKETTMPFNLMRLYVGFEEPDVLIADLKQALAAL